MPPDKRQYSGQIPTAEAPAAAADAPGVTEPLDLAEPNQWKAIDRTFTVDEVLELLSTLSDWWGVRPEYYIDYVQGITQTETVKVRETRSGRLLTVDRKVSVTVLYVAVAGRLAALQDVQELNKWEVDLIPDPITPSGAAGYLELTADRIINRELCVVRYWDLNTGSWREKGRRAGTAWAKRAHGSAPQMAETAARGRAIAGWGIGVLPGSGVASYEEMRLHTANLGGGGEPDEDNGDQPAGGSRRRRSKDDLIRDALLLAAQLAEVKGVDDLEKWTGLASYCQRTFEIDIAVKTDEGGNVLSVDLSRLRDGHLTLMVGYLTRQLARARTDDMG